MKWMVKIWPGSYLSDFIIFWKWKKKFVCIDIIPWETSFFFEEIFGFIFDKNPVYVSPRRHRSKKNVQNSYRPFHSHYRPNEGVCQLAKFNFQHRQHIYNSDRNDSAQFPWKLNYNSNWKTLRVPAGIDTCHPGFGESGF